MTTGSDLLKAWRTKKGLSQAECARRLGAAQSAWNTWETGVRSPQVRLAIALEDLTEGDVPVRSWAELPADDAGNDAAE